MNLRRTSLSIAVLCGMAAWHAPHDSSRRRTGACPSNRCTSMSHLHYIDSSFVQEVGLRQALAAGDTASVVQGNPASNHSGSASHQLLNLRFLSMDITCLGLGRLQWFHRLHEIKKMFSCCFWVFHRTFLGTLLWRRAVVYTPLFLSAPWSIDSFHVNHHGSSPLVGDIRFVGTTDHGLLVVH